MKLQNSHFFFIKREREREERNEIEILKKEKWGLVGGP